jgi:2,4-dienoyl-CoA reductase-like NADH-dependent reductase (Old Yellow Enzyme family)
MTSSLFTPFQLGDLTLTNRIVIAPMCQYSARDGSATDWHMMHLGQLAISGAGLLILEASAVTPEGRITPGDLGLYRDENEAALERVLTAIRSYSPMPVAIQLAHAGRKASCKAPWEGGAQIPPTEPEGWRCLAPSAIPFDPRNEPPEALDEKGIATIVAAFAEAARRADRLGLDGIELHGAHGYLIHAFLSPLSNRRTDGYGGSLENRMRFALEVFDAVRAAFPAEKPVGLRVSATDWVEGGLDLAESIIVAKAFAARGLSYIHVSTGGLHIDQSIPVAPSYQVPFAKAIRAETGLPTIAVGLITEPEQAEGIIASGEADMVSLARGMLYDPRWPWHAAAKLGAQVRAPNQYLRCQPRELKRLLENG